MSTRNVQRLIISFLLACMLAACGGGGGSGEGPSGSSAGPSELAFPLNVVVSNARFLLFPNSQRLAIDASLTGTEQTNSAAYANAYYAAIDPNNERLTKTAWMAKNGFGMGGGNEEQVVFGDQKDLGYGRRMTARRTDADGSLAFFVDNYLVSAGGSGYAYSSLNVDAAVKQSSQHFVSTSAIEYTDLDGPGGATGPKFVKFYVFDTSGNRKIMVNQDGLGEKAMPLICVSCHGGRADRLTTGNLFPLVGNAASRLPPALDADSRGDTTSRLQTLKVHTFDFSALTDSTTSSVRTRTSQEPAMKMINQWVHATYGNTGVNEWDGSVAQQTIEEAYGGASFPSATYNDAAALAFLPNDWAAQPVLYRNAVNPGCMTCHILRGTKNQTDISFATNVQFNAYADRIKAHVFDRGNMPLVNLVFNEFWRTGSSMPQLFAGVPTINAEGASASLKPGRPIADPGPNRYVRQGSLALTAINSLYASSFSWSLVSNPGNGASFTGSTSGTSTSLNFATDGTYVVRLTASGNGLAGSKDLTILVDNAGAPATPSFATDIQPVLSANCTASCHSGNLTTAGRPPLSYLAADYATPAEFLNTVKGRINFTDISASPLLRKPSNNHHGGFLVTGFGVFDPLNNNNTKIDSVPVGDASRRQYDLFVSWIMAGAPP